MAKFESENSDLVAALEFMESVDPSAHERVATMSAMDAPLTQELTTALYANLYLRPHLGVRERAMVMVAVAAACGLNPQVRYQLRFSLLAGATVEQLREVLRTVALMAGWGAAINAAMLLGQVTQEIEAERNSSIVQ